MNIKLYDNLATGGELKLANPNAELGFHHENCVIEIKDVPDNTPKHAFLQLVNGVTFLPATHDNKGRYSYNFSELLPGKIIHA